jgi:hypothetical protein
MPEVEVEAEVGTEQEQEQEQEGGATSKGDPQVASSPHYPHHPSTSQA